MNLVIIMFILLSFLWMVLTVHQLLKWKNQIAQAWVDLEGQCKERYGLALDLNLLLKPYLPEAGSLPDNIIQSRSRCLTAQNEQEKLAAENTLSLALSAVWVRTREIPAFQADSKLINLQKRFIKNEAELQLARNHYNRVVHNYNIIVGSFPALLIAGWFGHMKMDYYELEPSFPGINRPYSKKQTDEKETRTFGRSIP